MSGHYKHKHPNMSGHYLRNCPEMSCYVMTISAKTGYTCIAMSKRLHEEDKPPGHKEEKVEFRADSELTKKAREKARQKGWTLSSVLRAFMMLWAEDELGDPPNIGEANDRAPRTKKKKGEEKK